MSEFLKPPIISFKVSSTGAAIETILSLLKRELQMLNTEDRSLESDLTIDLSQRVTGSIVVNLVPVDDSVEQNPQTEEATSGESISGARCLGVVNVTLNVARCPGVVN